MAKKEYYYYYYDEKHDDFANNGIEGHAVPKGYIYWHTNPVYRFFKPIIYYVTLFFFYLGLKLACRVPQKNRKVLKNREEKKKGFFIYGNHTGWFPDAVSGPSATFPRQCYTIVNPDAINIPGLKTLVPMWGGIPTPGTKSQYKEYLEMIELLYQRGNPIVVYPEAHIWPKYNEIRDFDSIGFYYPVKFGAPCFTKTTIFKKKKSGKTRAYMVYDGPFYPRQDLPFKEAQEDLKNRVREQMIKRITQANSKLDKDYHYIQVDCPEKVRTEVKMK